MPLHIDPKRDRAWLEKARDSNECAIETQVAPPAPRQAPARTARTGLTALLRAGWSISYDSLLRIRLTRGPLSTDYCATEADACRKARELARGKR